MLISEQLERPKCGIITQTQREGKVTYDCLLGRSQAGRVKYKYTTCEAREKERGTENLLLEPPGSTHGGVGVAIVDGRGAKGNVVVDIGVVAGVGDRVGDDVVVRCCCCCCCCCCLLLLRRFGVDIIVVVVVEDVGIVVAAAAAGVDVGVDVGGVAAAAESARVACAVLVSGVPVAVAVVVVVACACKFVKVSIKRRAYVAAGVFIPFLPPLIIVADDSGPFSSLDVLSLCGCIRACGRLWLFPFP